MIPKMTHAFEQPIPEDNEKIAIDPKKEERYEPGEYQVDISESEARKDIEKNFPEFKDKKIEYLSEGMGSTAFVVNEEIIFRFAKNEKADASIEKENRVLHKVQAYVDLAIPNFEYRRKGPKGFNLIGYKKIAGRGLKKEDLISREGEVNIGLTQQLSKFFKQLHSIPITVAKEWGLEEKNFRSVYENELEDAKDYVYPLLKEKYPDDFQKIKEYIENLFSNYLSDPKNFEYNTPEHTPAVLHGDLEAEHIIFDEDSKNITGIIDWGGIRIGDPDYDIFRPYSHFGKKFLSEFLKNYPHPNPDLLIQKVDFFFRAQMIHRVVRPVILEDIEGINWHLPRLRKQALGIGYWYDELKENQTSNPK